uniref:NAD(P)H-quinone oxidoreductase subunit N, chloroplastic n=1 Tax=Araucaria cunninghamii TaxID=56994 RepID=A0A0D6R4N0_ARACU
MACNAVKGTALHSVPKLNHQRLLKANNPHNCLVGAVPKWQSSARGSAKFCRSTRAPTRQLTARFGRRARAPRRQSTVVRCAIEDFIGGDLLGFDLGPWYEDVERHKALAIYPPHEGGYSGKYATKLRREGYHFLTLTARGLGDPETYLTKVHAVRPAHLGKQPIARFYMPPEIDYRLSLLPPTSKGLVLWLIEAMVLSKTELQFLALLPAIRPKVKVIAQCGNWRKFKWKPLREIAGLPPEEK